MWQSTQKSESFACCVLFNKDLTSRNYRFFRHLKIDCCICFKESGGQLAESEKLLSEAEKAEATAVAKLKSGKESVSSEEKKKKQLEKIIKDVSLLLLYTN